ncbi:hypothetical protein R83H12_01421 [Fibrobacteria bacterium R8-3-H12]
MGIYGKLLFASAITISIFIANRMFVYAIIAGIVCALLIEIIKFIKKRMEKNKLTCNECFHFMQNDSYAKPKHIGFCCHKQKKLDNCKICSGFLSKTSPK